MEELMAGCNVTRREFLGASVLGAALSPILADPAQAAAQAAGVKRADLPDLTVKEVKVYVADLGNIVRINTPESGEIVSIVTNSGIEGNFPLGNRGNPPGWLEYAKRDVPRQERHRPASHGHRGATGQRRIYGWIRRRRRRARHEQRRAESARRRHRHLPVGHPRQGG